MRKNFMTKMLTGVVAAATIASGAGAIGGVKAASNNDIAAAMEGYKNVLASKEADMNFGPGYFSVADFNEDGMPDLMYLKEGRDGRTRELYTFNDGNVVGMDESVFDENNCYEAYLNVDRNYFALSADEWIKPDEATGSDVEKETTEDAVEAVTDEATEAIAEETTEAIAEETTEASTEETTEATTAETSTEDDSFKASMDAYRQVLTDKGQGVGGFQVYDVNGDGLLDLYYVDSENDVEDVYIFIDGELYKSEGMHLNNVDMGKLVANYERNYYLVDADYYNHTGKFAD